MQFVFIIEIILKNLQVKAIKDDTGKGTLHESLQNVKPGSSVPDFKIKSHNENNKTVLKSSSKRKKDCHKSQRITHFFSKQTVTNHEEKIYESPTAELADDNDRLTDALNPVFDFSMDDAFVTSGAQESNVEEQEKLPFVHFSNCADQEVMLKPLIKDTDVVNGLIEVHVDGTNVMSRKHTSSLEEKLFLAHDSKCDREIVPKLLINETDMVTNDRDDRADVIDESRQISDDRSVHMVLNSTKNNELCNEAEVQETTKRKRLAEVCMFCRVLMLERFICV